MTKQILWLLLAVCVTQSLLTMGCGVRGEPLPPTTPPEIGRGQPTFRRATEPFAFSNVPPVATPHPAPAYDPNRDGSKTR